MRLWRPSLGRRFGLVERLLAVLLLVVLVDFIATTVVFERASTFELRQDDAARIAENLVLASRAIEGAPDEERPALARALSTRRFVVGWQPPGARKLAPVGLSRLRAQVIEFAPELAHGDLDLHLEGLSNGGNIGGSIRLTDGSTLTFGTYARAVWTLTASRIASLVLPTLLLVALAWLFLRATLRPLRLLVQATRRVGSGPPEPVPEQGSPEMRELIHAINAMQQRIHQSLLDRTQTMLAIGHDLRTPLARIQLRLDDAAVAPELQREITGDIDEMRHLLESLQAYVETGGDGLPARRIDLAVMARTLVDAACDTGGDATYEGPEHLDIVARPVSIRRALANLIDNALHYGGSARVRLTQAGRDVIVAVEDDGPGIPSDRLADAVQPFVRLDTSRARDTSGMGLGLAIVRRAAELEGGTLVLTNRPSGGLSAAIRLPDAANALPAAAQQ